MGERHPLVVEPPDAPLSCTRLGPPCSSLWFTSPSPMQPFSLRAAWVLVFAPLWGKGSGYFLLCQGTLTRWAYTTGNCWFLVQPVSAGGTFFFTDLGSLLGFVNHRPND